MAAETADQVAMASGMRAAAVRRAIGDQLEFKAPTLRVPPSSRPSPSPRPSPKGRGRWGSQPAAAAVEIARRAALVAESSA
jgi:hypothetical protein